MTPRDLIVTSLLLGAFVAAGGAYGILLSLAFAWRKPQCATLGRYAYAVQCAVLTAILAATPLDWWWKLLVAFSGIAYYFIPPLTWRYLMHLHHIPEESV